MVCKVKKPETANHHSLLHILTCIDTVVLSADLLHACTNLHLDFDPRIFFSCYNVQAAITVYIYTVMVS